MGGTPEPGIPRPRRAIQSMANKQKTRLQESRSSRNGSASYVARASGDPSRAQAAMTRANTLRRRVPAGVRVVAPAEARPRGAEQRATRPARSEVVVESARGLPSSGRYGRRGVRVAVGMALIFVVLLVGHARGARAGAGPRAVRLRRELPDVGRPRRVAAAGAELRERGREAVAGVEPARLARGPRRGRRRHVFIAVRVHVPPPGLLLARVVDGCGSSRGRRTAAGERGARRGDDDSHSFSWSTSALRRASALTALHSLPVLRAFHRESCAAA